MQVPSDLLFEPTKLHNIIVDFDFQQVAIRLQTKQNAVEQIPSPRVAMTRHNFGPFEE
jgi:hypothetical protein